MKLYSLIKPQKRESVNKELTQKKVRKLNGPFKRALPLVFYYLDTNETTGIPLTMGRKVRDIMLKFQRIQCIVYFYLDILVHLLRVFNEHCNTFRSMKPLKFYVNTPLPLLIRDYQR